MTFIDGAHTLLYAFTWWLRPVAISHSWYRVHGGNCRHCTGGTGAAALRPQQRSSKGVYYARGYRDGWDCERGSVFPSQRKTRIVGRKRDRVHLLPGTPRKTVRENPRSHFTGTCWLTKRPRVWTTLWISWIFDPAIISVGRTRFLVSHRFFAEHCYEARRKDWRAFESDRENLFCLNTISSFSIKFCTATMRLRFTWMTSGDVE